MIINLIVIILLYLIYITLYYAYTLIQNFSINNLNILL